MNINIGHEIYAQCTFYVYVSANVTADAASCWTLSAFILILEKSEPKIWMHTKHCSSSAKARTRQIKKYRHCIVLMYLHLMLKIFVRDAWIAPWIFYLGFLFRILWNDSASREQYARDVLFSHSTVETYFLFVSSKSVTNRDYCSRVVVIGY